MSISENLHNLGTLMKTNLEEKGIDGLTGNEGLTTLTNKILDIECNGSSKNIIAHVTGNNVSLGWSTSWLITTGDVVIDWGDGTSDTVNNPHTTLSHTYTDANGHLIIFDGTVTSLGYSCFHQSNLTNIVIPDSVITIGNRCFDRCSGLTSIIIPSSVTDIGNKCFYGCSGLTSVIIPNSVINLEKYCFQMCSGLTSVTIPNSLTELKDGCFWGCSSLTSIVIPNSITSIGTQCFYGCTSLVDYELYWETPPIQYDSGKMPVNTDTVFTIPYGTTSVYVNAGYPSDRLVEREST